MTQLFDVKQILDDTKTALKINGTAPDDIRVASKVFNRHNFFAVVLLSHAKQILSAFTAMEKG
jgi:hypothetical protein